MKVAIILGLAILILIIGFFIFRPEEEKGLIEAWIIEQDLNQYGDPKDTVYMGGTPLFDERTDESIDRYEYIIKNHPDRPWLK